MFLASSVVDVAVWSRPYHGFFPGGAAAGGLVARLRGDTARAAPIFRRSVGGVCGVVGDFSDVGGVAVCSCCVIDDSGGGCCES